MLKKVYLNKKEVPVVVPVRTLSEAVDWLEKEMLPKGHTLTLLELDGKAMDFDDLSATGSLVMTADSHLRVCYDTPMTLVLQTLDAINNLGGVIERRLKAMAVECWQLTPKEKPTELDTIVSDLHLVLQMVYNAKNLVEANSLNLAPILGNAFLLDKNLQMITAAASNADWRKCAHLLLNRLEPILKQLVRETETAQLETYVKSVTEAAAATASERR